MLTTAPHYNRDLEAEKRQPIQWTTLGVTGTSHLDGVAFVHVAMPRKGRSVLFRLLAWVWFHAISTVLAGFALPRFDVVIAPSPPLTIGVSAWLVCKLRGAAFVYNVQEIYPDVAVQLGALHNRTLIRFFSGLERFVYDRADAVTVISPGMEANLRAKGVQPVKLALIPNPVDRIDIPSAGQPNAFSSTHHLDGRFVVTYAGNIGKPQGLEIVIGAADALRDESSILFLVVGDGSEKRDIEQLVERKRLSNVLLLPYHPYSAVPEIYAASNLCLVLQAAGTGTTALPSKAVQIAGAGRPIVAVADHDSDLAGFVRAAGSGLVASPGHPEQLAAHVIAMKNDYDTWGARARAAQQGVVENYSSAHVVGAYSQLVTRLARA